MHYLLRHYSANNHGVTYADVFSVSPSFGFLTLMMASGVCRKFAGISGAVKTGEKPGRNREFGSCTVPAILSNSRSKPTDLETL